MSRFLGFRGGGFAAVFVVGSLSLGAWWGSGFWVHGIGVLGFFGGFLGGGVFCFFFLLVYYAMGVPLLVVWLWVFCIACVSNHLRSYSLLFFIGNSIQFLSCFSPRFICLVGLYLFDVFC